MARARNLAERLAAAEAEARVRAGLGAGGVALTRAGDGKAGMMGAGPVAGDAALGLGVDPTSRRPRRARRLSADPSFAAATVVHFLPC